MKLIKEAVLFFAVFGVGFLFGGCTVKAIGDPNRPIVIKAHVTIDIKGLKDTATGIEDFVSGKTAKDSSANQVEE